MPSSIPRGVSRLFLLLALVALAAVMLTAPPSDARSDNDTVTKQAPALKRVKASATLNSVGDRYVGRVIPIKGYTSNQTPGKHRLVLQHKAVGSTRWVKRTQKLVRNGPYRFVGQRVTKPGVARFRTVLYAKGRPVDVSNILRVRVLRIPAPVTCENSPSPSTCPKPADAVEQQTLDNQVYCQQLVVQTLNQERTITWVWSTVSKAWVQNRGPWRTVSKSERPASAEECLHIIDTIPSNAALSDLRIKNLDKCGAGDMLRTGGDCFMVEFVNGRKLLKFPVLTFNVGGAASEIIADRSSEQVMDWKGYETFYNSAGTALGSKYSPNVEFYYAGDGHNHWHVRDFDEYSLLDESGTSLVTGEKHGYCLQDNTSYTPMQGDPGVPDEAVYLESTSCGKGLPNALTIIHGLSRGWGDTYPTTLPDQALDVTGIPNGTYTVRVHADARGAVTESNENNNTATIRVTISDNDVTVDKESAQGGLP